MGSAVPGLIHIDKATRGARDSICPSDWVRFSVWTHGLDCLWVRGLVCSAVGVLCRRLRRPATSLASSPTTTAPKDGPGLRFREPAARSRQFAAEAGLTAYALMAAAAVAASPARSRNPVSRRRLPCHCQPRGGGSRGRRLRVRRSGWGSRDPPCRPIVPLADGLACGRTPPIVRTQGRS